MSNDTKNSDNQIQPPYITAPTGDAKLATMEEIAEHLKAVGLPRLHANCGARGDNRMDQ